jgi:hypothetical protein
VIQVGSGKGHTIGKSVLGGTKTKGKPGVPPYGPLTQTPILIEKVGKAAFYQAAERAAQTISAAIVPQFAIPLWTGYCIWNYGAQVYKEFESTEGMFEDRIVRVVIRQAYKIVVDELLSDVVGRSMERKIDDAVLEISSFLTRQGVFREITAGLRSEKESPDDLREFFITTVSNILNGLYAGAQSEIIDYITR